jgi:hypothetical protein
MTISALAAWMKGIGSNQVREIAKGALAAMDPIPSADFAHIVNRKTTTVKDAPFLTAPIVGAAAHRTIPKGTAVVPVVLDEGAGGPWYGCWLYDDAPAGYVLGWFGPGNLNPLEPNEAPELPPGEPPPGSGDYEQGQADERAKWQEWMAARPISVQETWLEAAPDDS